MKISIISNIFNVIGNFIFIFVLHMGVSGAAFATMLSRFFCAVAIMFFLRNPKQIIVIKDYFSFRPQISLIARVLKIGVPSGIENGMFQFGKLMIQSTVSTMGTIAIAAQAMTNTLEYISGIFGIGVGIGLVTMVAQAIGAEKNSATLCMEMVVMITFVKPLLWPLSFIPDYGLQAGGDVRFSMVISTLSMWGARVMLCIFLVKTFQMGSQAVWYGMFLDWGIRSVIFSLRFISEKWIRKI